MNGKKIVGGGVAAGIIFYAVSLIVYALLKFLPVIPFSLAVPPQGLGRGWQIEHLLVSIFAGLMWSLGYAIWGKGRQGGWLYGAGLYLTALLPAFVANFILAPAARTLIVYGAIVSLVGALLGARAIAFVVKR